MKPGFAKRQESEDTPASEPKKDYKQNLKPEKLSVGIGRYYTEVDDVKAAEFFMRGRMLWTGFGRILHGTIKDRS